jgi:Spy/CpxP family protein refolding chaperone
MNRKVWMTLGAVLLAGVIAVPILHAERTWHGRGGSDQSFSGMEAMGPFGHLRGLRSKLDLSDDQVTQIKAIFKTVHDQNAASRTQIRTNMRAAAKSLLSDPTNVAGAQQILDQNSATEQQLKANLLSGVAKAITILTPDQRARLGQILDARANRA